MTEDMKYNKRGRRASKVLYVYGRHAGDQALRELASPGKSGSVFFVSHDDKYMIKTMRKVRRRCLHPHRMHLLAAPERNMITLSSPSGKS